MKTKPRSRRQLSGRFGRGFSLAGGPKVTGAGSEQGLTYNGGQPILPMSDFSPSIRILDEPIDRETLRELVSAWFEDMVKYVVDVARGRIAIGGELHADAEEVLLDAGSRQQDLWGANYYPGRGRDGCIEFTSLINISPARGNRGMELADPALRARIQTLTWALIGEGEDL